MTKEDILEVGIKMFGICSGLGVGISLIGTSLGLPKFAIVGLASIAGAVAGHHIVKIKTQEIELRDMVCNGFVYTL